MTDENTDDKENFESEDENYLEELDLDLAGDDYDVEVFQYHPPTSSLAKKRTLRIYFYLNFLNYLGPYYKNFFGR